jgi:toxin ParE1/3/4
MPKVYQRTAARLDLLEHFAFLADQAGLDVADRFLAHAESSFNDLADQPMMGAPLTLKASGLAGLRRWRIRDFESYLVFYLPRSDGVSIVRVLHGARDWWNLVGIT